MQRIFCVVSGFALVVGFAVLTNAAVGAEPALVSAPRHMKVGSGVYAVKASIAPR